MEELLVPLEAEALEFLLVRVSVRVRVRVGVTRPPYFWKSAAVSLRSSESIVPVVGWWVGQ